MPNLLRQKCRGLQGTHTTPHLQHMRRIGRLSSSSTRQCLRILAQSSDQQQLETITTAAVPPNSTATSNIQQQWYKQSNIFYSNYPLDRAAEARRDESQVMAWFNATNTKVTPVNGSRILVTPSTASSTAAEPSSNTSNGSSTGTSAAVLPSLQPVWISPAAELGCAISPAVPPIFLGLDPATETPHFAVQVLPSDTDALAASHGARWVSARTAGPDMSRPDASLMAVASGLATWHMDAQYHGGSGSKTLPKDGGFARKCPSSGRSLYPRIDPAIITLVTGGQDWCLLGRKHGWPKGRYSTLAGFLEVGETLEQALCREVAEESGVLVDLHSVRYVASQPWPFPRSLMVGFYAAAAAAAAATQVGGSSSGGSSSSSRSGGGSGSSGGSNPAAGGGVELLSHQGLMAMMDTGLKPSEVAEALRGAPFLQPPTPQEGEMEDVRWFHRDWLRWALQLGAESAPEGFMIPGTYSLAHKLITGWLQQQPTSTAAPPDAAAAAGGYVSAATQDGQPVIASSSSSGSGSSDGASSWLVDQVPQVQIDEGVFKYVLLRLVDSKSGRSKLLVRGAAAAAYHNHILQHTKGQLQQLAPQGQLQLEVLGGGRIEHYAEQRVMSVYGYSAAFGPAVHEVTVALLRKWYPFYQPGHITYSYEGY